MKREDIPFNANDGMKNKEYVPYSKLPADVVGTTVIRKKDGFECIVTACNRKANKVYLGNYVNSYHADIMFKAFTHIDGSPFGECAGDEAPAAEFSLNDDVTIYPNENGWKRIRKIVYTKHALRDVELERFIQNRTSDDGGYTDQLWSIIHDLGDMIWQGTNCIESTKIVLKRKE